ncbi:MAG: hypothetical protein QM731_07220 [Chitinophagaceae bacterium]
MYVRYIKACLLLLLYCSTTHIVQAQKDDAAELAKKLSNPVSSLISVPFQNNNDYGIGKFRGSRNTMNIQPVVPVALTPKLNLITRIIMPVITQNSITEAGKKQFGLGDFVLSGFISPSQSKNGVTWGAGPVFLLPTGTNDYLASKKFGIGPTAVGLKQTGGWTFGALVNQVWSVAGDKDRADVNQMFLQPFLFYNWKSGAGLGVNSEYTQNWQSHTTNIFLNPLLSGVTSVGKQKVQLGVGPRINIIAPSEIRAEWGWRTVLVLLFPK